MKKRSATIERKTKETNIRAAINLDGPPQYEVETGLPFLDHMLEAFACHGRFDLKIMATGDLKVDPHHLIEDLGIVLGQAVTAALDDNSAIQRAGFFSFPMDGSLANVAVDLCGRPNLVWNVELEGKPIGQVDVKLLRDYYKGLADGLKATIHVQVPYRDNDHHALEAVSKAFGRALKEALCLTGQPNTMSTKGLIDA